MTIELAITLLGLGLVGGFFSGWLGIGGGIIMAPLLLYVPPALGVANPDMKVVAGLTMVQSLFATGSGVIVHRRFQFVSRELVLWMGGIIAVASLTGAVLSRFASAGALMGVFVVLALIAAVMMLIPKKEPSEEPHASEIDFSRPLAAACALILGLVGGLVGQSGAFIIIPVLLYVLKIPTRTTIGSSLGIVFLAALAGSAGKVVTGQVEMAMAVFLIAGALLGAQGGGYLSQITRRRRLRQVLALVIAATAVGMALDLAGV
ncbi:MAG: sulfite exporter TauE/SafE family protein [Thermoleophilia bacterium]|nr:sulfite exporter TauE/SafE family protein [Thermoleophilia bacterium]